MKLILSTNLPINIIDLDTSINEMKCDLEKSISVQQLYHSVGMQIMLITLDAQTELKKHSAPGPISVQVIKGSISFRTDDTDYDLKEGQLLTLEARLPHSVYANESSSFLITKSIPQ